MDLLLAQKKALLQCFLQPDRNQSSKEDASDDFFQTKQQQQRKHSHQQQHIQNSNELGYKLIERRVQKWKVLILDNFTFKIVSSLFNVGDLRSYGITLTMNIQDKRQAIPDAPAIYILEPSKSNIQHIIQDASFDLYEKCFLNFTCSISRELLEEMASQFVKFDCVSKIASIFDQYLNFYCYENDFFSLELDQDFSIINKPNANEKEMNNYLDQICSALLSVLVTSEFISQYKIQCIATGNCSQMIADKLQLKLKHYYTSHPLHSNTTTIFPLLLVDRTVDYKILLQHGWSYQSLLFDLFDMKHNKITIPSTGKTFTIDFQDEFYKENKFVDFQQVCQKLSNVVDDIGQQLNQYNKKYGLDLNEEELLQGDMNKIKGEQVKLNHQMMEEAFQLSDAKKKVAMHTNLSYALLNEVKNRKLDEFVVMEQKLLEGGYSMDRKDVETLHSLFTLETVQLEDQIRLFLICYLLFMYSSNNTIQQHIQSIFSKEELQQWKQLILKRRNQSELWELNCLEQLHVNHGSVQQQQQHEWATSSSLPKNTSLKNLTASLVNSTSLRNSINLFGEQLKSLAQVTGLSNTLSLENQPLYPYETTQLVSHHLGKQNKCMIFVCGGGGSNFIEYQNMKQYLMNQQQEPFQFIMGTTNLSKAIPLMEQMKQLMQQQ